LGDEAVVLGLDRLVGDRVRIEPLADDRLGERMVALAREFGRDPRPPVESGIERGLREQFDADQVVDHVFARDPFATALRVQVEFGLEIYPNPFSSSTTVQLSSALQNGELTVFNIRGQQVKTMKNISGKEIKFFRDDLSNGIYFMRLMENNKLIVADKFVVN
ncbi:MAG TPA: T9SS type A sorting domain-containing protein, partial [Bacteroidia bacterium]|nr:T9SS type A sorting domain-containing protein [Bacteroidia bacterium]